MRILKFLIFALIFSPFFCFSQEKIYIFPSPIFKHFNLYPGREISVQVFIENKTLKNYQRIILKGEKILDEGNFSQALELKVQNLNPINLGEFLNGKSLNLEEKIIPRKTTKLNFTLSFKEKGERDNLYQGKKLAFNFIFEFLGKERERVRVPGVVEEKEARHPEQKENKEPKEKELQEEKLKPKVLGKISPSFFSSIRKVFSSFLLSPVGIFSIALALILFGYLLRKKIK